MAFQESILEQYQAYLTRIGKSSHTVKAYTHDVDSFAKWWAQTTGEVVSPRLVDPREIGDYRSFMLQRRLKPATINRRLKAMTHFFRWAKRMELTTENPFDVLENVSIKKQQDTAPRWLDYKEQLALLRAVRKAESQRDLAVVQTLLGTGLRISELAALNVSDVELSERKGMLYVRVGKGMKARQIPLDRRTRQVLSDYLEVRPEMDGLSEEERERLFFGQRGPLTEREIDYLVTKYAYQAQLENCTAHTLRHSFGKNLIDSGTPADQVATLMGHESLDTTKIYTRPSQRDLERAVRRAA